MIKALKYDTQKLIHQPDCKNNTYNINEHPALIYIFQIQGLVNFYKHHGGFSHTGCIVYKVYEQVKS